MFDFGLTWSTLSKQLPMRAHEGWTRQQLEVSQTSRLRRLPDYAYAHSPFYQQFHKGLYQSPLRDLPVLTKARLMENFDELASDRRIHLADVRAYMESRRGHARYLGRYWVNSTSGTSGHPGLFVVDQDEWSTELATALRAFQWAGMKLNVTRRTKIAQITSTNPFHLSMQGGADVANWWMPTLLMDANEPLAGIVARLNAWQPDMLWAYASIIRALADEQQAGRLQITPTTVLSASELLTEGTRRRAGLAWGDVVFNTYATTDCGGIAAECDQHRGMHLLEDLVIVEVVDQHNCPAAPGVFGDKLLVTVLGSRTQPLIRYELEDGVRLAKTACPCGRPFRLIDAVQGRAEEVLSFPSTIGGEVAIHPVAFANIMDGLPLAGWQIVQEGDGLHLLLLKPTDQLDKGGLTESVRRMLEEHGVSEPRIETRTVARIPQTAAGKTSLVVSHLARGRQ